MIKSVGKRAFAAVGYTVSKKQTEVDPRIPETLASMWPVSTDFDLARFGGATDGAYLIPEDLAGIDALYSPGVDQVAQFEADISALGIKCYLADASVDKPPVSNSMFQFDRKFIGLVDEGDLMTMDTWVERDSPGTSDLMLQMDIEGAEWGVLANMSSKLLSRFRIMVIEFHDLSRMFDSFGAGVMTNVFNRLCLTHHVVHIHPNNCAGFTERGSIQLPEFIEVTYLRKDRSPARGYAKQFPHTLDVINVPSRPTYALPSCWYA